MIISENIVQNNKTNNFPKFLTQNQKIIKQYFSDFDVINQKQSELILAMDIKTEQIEIPVDKDAQSISSQQNECITDEQQSINKSLKCELSKRHKNAKEHSSSTCSSASDSQSGKIRRNSSFRQSLRNLWRKSKPKITVTPDSDTSLNSRKASLQIDITSKSDEDPNTLSVKPFTKGHRRSNSYSGYFNTKR